MESIVPLKRLSIYGIFAHLLRKHMVEVSLVVLMRPAEIRIGAVATLSLPDRKVSFNGLDDLSFLRWMALR